MRRRAGFNFTNDKYRRRLRDRRGGLCLALLNLPHLWLALEPGTHIPSCGFGSPCLPRCLPRQLGNGHFASVHRGRCRRTGKEVAIKIVPKSKQTAASIRHEAAVLKRVSMHKRIASLEALYETPDCFYIVMEYVGGGELFDHLCDHGAMTEREAATLVSELAGAIAILHAQGMCHADIKPENLLLTSDGHVKLVDFGLSCQFDRRTGGRVDPNVNGSSVGTMAYWAPEVRCGLQRAGTHLPLPPPLSPLPTPLPPSYPLITPS